ncbi:hypothetical protein F8388_004266 [Cannabis sativa]|uniref:DUF4283 domain-containing protein n=1 Tax=Cannabis sativa TaxID=3483 RepID=A0A7J6F7B9_CANSA|nr:hypothetical protein F8388_004266 [Cannabis sativa]
MGRVNSTNSIMFFLGFAAFFSVISMDLELVNRLAEVLVLDEGDRPVISLNKAGIEEGKKRMDLCLVGKVIGPRPANKDGIEKAMKGVWKINHRFQVEELNSKNDRQRVYGGGPWTIDKQLICFVKPMGLGEISKMNFDFTSFWISINNVPLVCMTELFAREWGERIGKLEDIKIVNGIMKALDCPLKDFDSDNPKFDSGRFGSWLCAPSSPPRDRFRVQRQRESSLSHRPIMTMGEASRIVSAVAQNGVRYSGPTPEELAPTSVLEAREREELVAEELVSKGPAVQHETVAPEGNFPMVVDEIRVTSVLPEVERAEVLSKVSSTVDGSAVVDNVVHVGVSGMQVSSGECSKGGDKVSSLINVEVDVVDEVIGHSKEKLTKEQKSKGVLDHSSQDEISFRHALQQTFDPIIKAQKAKTWKRLSSASGRGSKGGSKPSFFPISPKLSHVMVANAKYKLSPKVSVKSFSVGHIDALVQCPGRSLWRFTGFYGNPKPSCRSESWRLLCRLKDLFDLPWICGGDFNEVLSINEKKGGADRSLCAISDFQQALDKCSLADMGFQGQCFTWINKRQGAAHVQERLIAFVATRSGITCFLQVQKNDKPRGFRFETHWLKDEECHEIVTQTWLVPDGPLESQDSVPIGWGRGIRVSLVRYLGS